MSFYVGKVHLSPKTVYIYGFIGDGISSIFLKVLRSFKGVGTIFFLKSA